MIKLSKTSKLDGIMSWSLQALETCQGSIGTDGQLVDACKGCYATTGNYVFANVKAPRAFNKEDWQRVDWVFDMVAGLAKQTHFRWFDSGDVYHLGLAEKILEVMIATPHVKHWMPTRMHKFAKYADVLARMHCQTSLYVTLATRWPVGLWTARQRRQSCLTSHKCQLVPHYVARTSTKANAMDAVRATVRACQ